MCTLESGVGLNELLSLISDGNRTEQFFCAKDGLARNEHTIPRVMRTTVWDFIAPGLNLLIQQPFLKGDCTLL